MDFSATVTRTATGFEGQVRNAANDVVYRTATQDNAVSAIQGARAIADLANMFDGQACIDRLVAAEAEVAYVRSIA